MKIGPGRVVLLLSWLSAAACAPPREASPPAEPTTTASSGNSREPVTVGAAEPGLVTTAATASPDGHDAAPPSEPSSAAHPTRIPGTGIHFEGGDGHDFDAAIRVLGAQGELDGVEAEYSYLAQVYGPRGVGWTLVSQALVERDGKRFDVLRLSLPAGRAEIVFDISDYFGRF